jgi:hypothetical protein
VTRPRCIVTAWKDRHAKGPRGNRAAHTPAFGRATPREGASASNGDAGQESAMNGWYWL